MRINRALLRVSVVLVPSDSPSALERVVRWIPPLLIAIAIYLGSSLPPGEVPGRLLVIHDKVAHFIEYYVLAGALVPAVRASWRSQGSMIAVAAAVLAATLFGVTDELHQLFVPGRDASAYDLLADAVGAFCGAGTTAWLTLRIRGGE